MISITHHQWHHWVLQLNYNNARARLFQRINFHSWKDPGDVFVFTELPRQKFGFMEGPEKKESNPVGGVAA